MHRQYDWGRGVRKFQDRSCKETKKKIKHKTHKFLHGSEMKCSFSTIAQVSLTKRECSYNYNRQPPHQLYTTRSSVKHYKLRKSAPETKAPHSNKRRTPRGIVVLTCSTASVLEFLSGRDTNEALVASA